MFLFSTGFCLDSPGPLDSKEKYVFTAFKCLCLGTKLFFFITYLLAFNDLHHTLGLAVASKTPGSCKQSGTLTSHLRRQFSELPFLYFSCNWVFHWSLIQALAPLSDVLAFRACVHLKPSVGVLVRQDSFRNPCFHRA